MFKNWLNKRFEKIDLNGEQFRIRRNVYEYCIPDINRKFAIKEKFK